MRPDGGRLGFFVLRSGALGDFVLTFPVLAAIRRLFARAEVVLGARSQFGRLACASGLADDLVSEDSPEIVRLYAEPPDGGRALRERLGRFDVAVSFVLSPEVRRNLLAAGVRELHCRAARPRRPDNVVVPTGPHPSSGLHAADHLLAVMSGLGPARRIASAREGACVPSPAVPRLTLREEDCAEAETLLRGQALEPRRYLALHPGSGSPNKDWPLERFVDLARRVRTELGLKVLVVAGPVEEERRGEIEAAFCGTADMLLWRPELVTLAGVLAASAAYLGNDSGVTHLAAAVGARVVAVFGPTDPAVWGPRGEEVRVLRHGSGEIEKVSVDEVLTRLARPDPPWSN